MTWRAYRLVYQAKSPIHIGWHTLGYINLTRYYIPGRTMWGAFTANLVRAQENKDQGQYEKIGKLLRTNIIMSYFFPALDEDHPLLPEYTDEGIKFGCNDNGGHIYSSEEFERLFISSYGQTAVVPDSNTAEDTSLHESEFIAHVINENKHEKPVYFVGYIFINDQANIDGNSVGWEEKEINLKDAISEIFVGGDRTYGWGRLVLDEMKTQTLEKTDNNFFNCRIKLDVSEGWPTVTIPKNGPIPAHLNINSNMKIKGDIEPLVGRAWGTVEYNDDKGNVVGRHGAGQLIERLSAHNNLFWLPGSVITEEADPPDPHIGSYGLLMKVRG